MRNAKTNKDRKTDALKRLQDEREQPKLGKLDRLKRAVRNAAKEAGELYD